MICKKCGMPLVKTGYKYYKQTGRCWNCDFIRIPLACSDVIP